MKIQFDRARLVALSVLGITGLTLSHAAQARDIVISGSPSTVSVAGRAYAFTPATTGDVGRRMTFSIANKPSWASFSVYNGSLTGTPSATNAGTYPSVVVSVTDGTSRDSLPAFTLTVSTLGTPTLVNHAPTISGTPPTSINSGQTYNFVPTAKDTDGNTLRFSISSKPAWATFDAVTGRLWGVPTTAQAGSYEQIQISVSDGKVAARLPQFAVNVASVPTTRTASISWQPSMLNTDGTALTNLAGYKILFGAQSHTYTSTVTLSNAGLTRYVLENLPAGKYYFSMVAVNSDGTESDRSTEVLADLS